MGQPICDFCNEPIWPTYEFLHARAACVWNGETHLEKYGRQKLVALLRKQREWDREWDSQEANIERTDFMNPVTKVFDGILCVIEFGLFVLVFTVDRCRRWICN